MRVVIVGAGKVGYSIAQYLVDEDHDVIIVEQDEQRRAIVQNNLDVMTIGGNGASPEVLMNPNVRNASLLIAVTDSDEVNMITCMAAKQVGIRQTIARVRNQEYASQTYIKFNQSLGIDLTINPELVTAYEISRTLLIPAALDVEDFLEGRVRMLEVKISPDSKIINKPLKDLTLPPHTLITGILRQNQMIIPRGSDMILPHDSVFIIGRADVMDEYEKNFNDKKPKIERVMIIGAGRIGRNLAPMLEKQGLAVKVIDKDPARCQELSNVMQKGLVLCGEGTDMELLVEEGVGEADAVVCLTDDDKLNLLLALIARDLGAKKTIVRAGRPDYIPLMEKVGVDVVLSPRLLTAGVILRHVRRGSIVHVTLLEGMKAEAVEVIVSENSRIAGKALKDIKFPEQTLIGAVGHGDEMIIPNGETVLHAGDRAVIFSLPHIVNKVLKLFEGRG